MTDQLAAPAVQARMIDVAGTPVAMRRKGEGDPLLFLHGAGFTGHWLPFHEALAQGADVLAPEHIGFGETPFQEWLEGVDDLAFLYDDLRRQEGIDKLDVVGFSLGGWIAAEYAVLFPDSVRSLTLIVPVGLRVAGKPVADIFAMTPEEQFATFFNDPTNALPYAPDLEDVDTVVRLYDEASTLARLMWNPRFDPKLERRLRRATMPALVIGGDPDRAVPDEMADLYAERLPAGRLERVAGAGHMVIVEQPERVAQLALEHIGGAR
jgi:pimeloyl-ACP methyl ester carboxylesterase